MERNNQAVMIELEQARIRAFAETELGQLVGCLGSCHACGARADQCELNEELRKLGWAAPVNFMVDLYRRLYIVDLYRRLVS